MDKERDLRLVAMDDLDAPSTFEQTPDIQAREKPIPSALGGTRFDLIDTVTDDERVRDFFALYGKNGNPAFDAVQGNFGPDNRNILESFFTDTIMGKDPDREKKKLEEIRQRIQFGYTGEMTPELQAMAEQGRPIEPIRSPQGVRRAFQTELDFNPGPAGQPLIDMARMADRRLQAAEELPAVVATLFAELPEEGDAKLMEFMQKMNISPDSVNSGEDIARLVRFGEGVKIGLEEERKVSREERAQELFDTARHIKKFIEEEDGRLVDRRWYVHPRTGAKIEPAEAKGKPIITNANGVQKVYGYNPDGTRIVLQEIPTALDSNGNPIGDIQSWGRIAADVRRGKQDAEVRFAYDEMTRRGVAMGSVINNVVLDLRDAITGDAPAFMGALGRVASNTAGAMASIRATLVASGYKIPGLEEVEREFRDPNSALSRKSPGMHQAVLQNRKIAASLYNVALLQTQTQNWQSTRATPTEAFRKALEQIASNSGDPSQVLASIQTIMRDTRTIIDSRGERLGENSFIYNFDKSEWPRLFPDIFDGEHEIRTELVKDPNDPTGTSGKFVKRVRRFDYRGRGEASDVEILPPILQQ